MSSRFRYALVAIPCFCLFMGVVGCGRSDAPSAEDPLVYAVDGDGYYHITGCPDLGADAKSLLKSAAEAKGLKACSRCLDPSSADMSVKSKATVFRPEAAPEPTVSYDEELYGKRDHGTKAQKPRKIDLTTKPVDPEKAKEMIQALEASGKKLTLGPLNLKKKETPEALEKTAESGEPVKAKPSKTAEATATAKSKTVASDGAVSKAEKTSKTGTDKAGAKATAKDETENASEPQALKRIPALEGHVPSQAYIAPGVSKCFHSDKGCRALRHSKDIKDVGGHEAIKQGFTPCSLCVKWKSSYKEKTAEEEKAKKDEGKEKGAETKKQVIRYNKPK